MLNDKKERRCEYVKREVKRLIAAAIEILETLKNHRNQGKVTKVQNILRNALDLIERALD